MLEPLSRIVDHHHIVSGLDYLLVQLRKVEVVEDKMVLVKMVLV